MHVVADREGQLGALLEDLPRPLVGDQVELTLAVAHLGVFDSVEKVGRVFQRRRQQGAGLDADREFPAFGDVQRPLHPDQVGDVEFFDPLEGLLAELVATGVGLDRAADVSDVEEDDLAVAALAGHPPHDPVAEVGVLALLQRLRVVRCGDVGGMVPGQEAVRVGIDPFLAQPLDPRPPLVLARPGGRAVGWIRGHGALPTLTRSLPS